jgi:hypothetical protein
MSMDEPTAATSATGDVTGDASGGASRQITPSQRKDALREHNRGR